MGHVADGEGGPETRRVWPVLPPFLSFPGVASWAQNGADLEPIYVYIGHFLPYLSTMSLISVLEGGAAGRGLSGRGRGRGRGPLVPPLAASHTVANIVSMRPEVESAIQNAIQDCIVTTNLPWGPKTEV